MRTFPPDTRARVRVRPSPPQDCISLGSGEPNASEYRSFVLYHNNGPRWSEMVKLPIPIDRFRGSHLRFEFRHCSSESGAPRRPSVHWRLGSVSSSEVIYVS